MQRDVKRKRGGESKHASSQEKQTCARRTEKGCSVLGETHGEHASDPDDETLDTNDFERTNGLFRILLTFAVVEKLTKRFMVE